MKFLAVAIAAFLGGVGAVGAQVELHYFWSATCPDCTVMKAFLDKLSQDYALLKVVSREVTFNPDNWRLMVTLAQAYGLTKEVTPMVIVGNLAVAGIGLANELRIQEEVARCAREGCPSPLVRLPNRLRPRLSPLEIVLILAVAVAALWILGGR